MRENRRDRRGELLFLERIGILRFRQLLLLWEAFFHRRDGRKNANYHLDGSSFEDIEGFRDYILYHVFLHLTGLTAVVLYAVCRLFLFPPSFFLFLWDLPMAALGLLHLYCLLLQRYTVLRLRRFEALRTRRVEKKRTALSEAVRNAYGGGEERGRDRAMLEKMLSRIRERRDVVLGPEEVETLRRVSACLMEAGIPLPIGPESCSPSPPIPGADPEKTPWPYGRTPRRAAWCVEKIGRWDSVLLSPSAFICTCPEAESAFREIFTPEGAAGASEVLEAAADCLAEDGTTEAEEDVQ